MGATIFTSLAFLSASVSMTNLSHLVAASFSSLALSSSVSMANLSCLLVTTFSSLKLLSNSLSSPRFHLLRVGRRCYSVVFCFLTFASYPQHTEAERATRTAETIDGLERNLREEKLLIDEKNRNNRRTEAEWASRRA